MDHNGLLSLVHKAQRLFIPKHPQMWQLQWTIIPFPESPCAYCGRIMRSPYIWFVDEPGGKLKGVMKVQQGIRACLIYSSHPHQLYSDGTLCKGSATTIQALISSPINLRDIPNIQLHIPSWIQTYWNHKCLYTIYEENTE